MQISLKEFFILGGWAMWPLLLFSISAVALILERSFYLFLHRLNVRDLAESILAVLAKGDVAEARSLCRLAPPRPPAAKIFLVALESIDLGEHRIERVMEAAAAKEVQALEKGFDLLTAIGSLHPLPVF
jgi:biopolymer transport protein ExbB